MDFNAKKIKQRKLRRKKRKYTQKGKGFGNRFKLLYSIGRQWRNSMQ